MKDEQPIRSFLFVPALRLDFLDKAAASGAGAVLVDLEDAIPPARKAEARATIGDWVSRLSGAGIKAAVRVNANDVADIQAVCAAGAWAVIVPKVNHTADLDAFRGSTQGMSSRPRLFATIETAKGVLACAEVARVADVSGLMFGAGDFAMDTGMAFDEDVLTAPCASVVIAARAAGLPAFGLPGPITDFRNLARLTALAQRARALGFSGTPVVHPRQVAIIEQVFGVSADEISRAQEIVRRFEASDGLPFSDEEGLIEWPIYEAARELLRSTKDR